MFVNEAPWLTRKIEITVVVLLFFVCLLADISKCKTGLFASCLGGEVSLCDMDIEQHRCHEHITPYPFIEQRSQCDCTSHDSSILFHVVQLGPPERHANKPGTAHAAPIGEYLSQSLFKRLGNVRHANATKGFLNASYFLHFRRSLELEPYDKDSVAARCNASPLTRFQISYSYDTIEIPERSDLLTDLSVALPFKNDYFSIPHYLPNLHQIFVRHTMPNRIFPLKKKNPCSLTHLVFVLALSPGVKTTWAHKNPTRAAEVLLEALRRIRRTISLYISKKPRYTRMLSSVLFVDVPIGYPARGAQDPIDPEKMMAHLCLESEAKTKRRCRAGCKQYKQFLPGYVEANRQLRNILSRTGGRRPQENVVLLPYRDYFVNNVGNRSQWENCLVLSQKGTRILSENIANELFSSTE